MWIEKNQHRRDSYKSGSDRPASVRSMPVTADKEGEKKSRAESVPTCVLSCGYINGYLNKCLAGTNLRVAAVEVHLSPRPLSSQTYL